MKITQARGERDSCADFKALVWGAGPAGLLSRDGVVNISQGNYSLSETQQPLCTCTLFLTCLLSLHKEKSVIEPRLKLPKFPFVREFRREVFDSQCGHKHFCRFLYLQKDPEGSKSMMLSK